MYDFDVLVLGSGPGGQKAAIATANYAGYLAGAMAGVAAPALLRSRTVYRSSLIVVVATLALMPVLTGDARWAALRFVTGCASALVFMVAASALLTGLRAHGQHLVGHGFGGVGAGIAASGVLVLVLRHGTWQDSWWSAAVLGAALSVAAWPLQPPATDNDGTDRGAGPAGRRWFTSLLLAYTLEGVGYIIAGTFLVAAIDQTASTTLGSSAWIAPGNEAKGPSATRTSFPTFSQCGVLGSMGSPAAFLVASNSPLFSRPRMASMQQSPVASGRQRPVDVTVTTAYGLDRRPTAFSRRSGIEPCSEW